MDQQGIKALKDLAEALSRQALTDQEYKTKEQERFFEQVNYEETEATLQDLQIPEGLQHHIPKTQAKFFRLSDQARKTRRSNFRLHKIFPAAATFKTGNRNKTLDRALKDHISHLQSNTKYNLAGLIETAALHSRTGALLQQRIQEHKQLPAFIKDEADKGTDLNQHVDYITERLQAEFGLYEDILTEHKAAYDRLQDLIFLANDAAADALEQINNVCLALQNLRPRKDTRPTRDDYRDAQRSGFGRRHFTPRGRANGRGSSFGRRGRYSYGGYTGSRFGSSSYGTSGQGNGRVNGGFSRGGYSNNGYGNGRSNGQ